jgi:hypothetical protein
MKKVTYEEVILAINEGNRLNRIEVVMEINHARARLKHLNKQFRQGLKIDRLSEQFAKQQRGNNK